MTDFFKKRVPAKQMQAQYLPQIQQKAATLDAGQVMALMRGA